MVRESSEIGSVEDGRKIKKCDANGHFLRAKERKDNTVKRRKMAKSKTVQE
jgi:hypothetical protein